MQDLGHIQHKRILDSLPGRVSGIVEGVHRLHNQLERSEDPYEQAADEREDSVDGTKDSPRHVVSVLLGLHHNGCSGVWEAERDVR